VIGWLLHRLGRPSHQWIVRDQVRAGKPPAVRAVYLELKASGMPPWRIWALLAAAHRDEVRSMLQEKRAFNQEAYAARLNATLNDPDLL
jgi:hypothetical protein